MPPENTTDPLNPEQIETDLIARLKAEGIDLVVTFGSKLLVAIIILVIGFWVARRLTRVVNKIMVKREVDDNLRPFFRSTAGFLIRAVVVIIAISTVGVETTSIIAVLGSIGLAIGLALQGSLSNFAGGILILTLKPIRKGEVIEAQGVMGRVEEINVMNTTVMTFDNKMIFLPNGPLAGGNITNYTRQKLRRVDITFGISYRDDIEKARNIILELANSSPYCLQEPAPPFVRVVSLGDSSVNLAMRVWTNTENYWFLFHDMIENVKQEFDRQGVTIPFPQRDVHLFAEK